MGLVGSAIGVVGAALFWLQQAQLSGGSIWPLPALVLIEWALLSIAGMLSPIRAVEAHSLRWLDTGWAVDGALLTMGVLGGFSIGPLVLLCLVPWVGASGVATSKISAPLIHCLGIFGLGAVSNLVVLLFLILLVRGV